MCSKISNEHGLNVEYYSEFYKTEKADEYLTQLKDLPFFSPTFKIRGKCAQPKRKILAYSDAGLKCAFSGVEISPLPWTPLMLKLREDVEKQVGCTFNYVLLNYYEDGSSLICNHKDNGNYINSTFPIAVLSFGQSRTLEFKKPNCETTSLNIEHGSLYLICNPTNKEFTHEMPPNPAVNQCRISLSFRHILPEATQMVVKKRKIMSSIADWYLDGNVFISVKCENNAIRIHLKNTSNNEYIVMTPPTWHEFVDKIFSFNTIYANASFIANNELCAFSQNEYCVLQQLICNLTSGFKLKSNFIRMDIENLNLLKTYSEEITLCIQNTLLCVILPSLIRKTCAINTEITENDFFK